MAKSNSDLSTTLIKAKITSQTSIGKKVLRQKSFDKSKPCAEISFKDFLDFLRTAYQVNDSLEGTVNDLCVQKYLDWQQVAKNELVTSLQAKEQKEETETAPSEPDKEVGEPPRPGTAPPALSTRTKSLTVAGDSAAKPAEASPSVDQLLKRKLNEMIQEGLLDSVLPYVVPKTAPAPAPTPGQAPAKKEPQPADGKKAADKPAGFSVSTSREKITGSRRKSFTGEPEVEIHVCDEVKNMKRDFRCPQKLLVSKMGYFAQVTTGQKLEDMDISVHCDIAIFDWLMRWVKRGTEEGPTLDGGNVVPILVSAAFLQMDPLLQDCLDFCHRHMPAIIQSSTTLACLNDSLLTRLASMFSNSEVEALRDRRDKISSRLYCKLIQSLADSSPEPARGHFATLSSLYRCGQCGKLVVSKLVAQVPCSPSHMQLSTSGLLGSSHSRDPNWNLSEYIRGLWSELQCWQLVYWRLWGDCHFLYCTTCDTHYPARQAQWCCHHPEEPQYFTKEGHRALTFPIGRYPCCGERSYRFQPVPQRSGCQFRDHQPDLSSDRDRAVHALYIKHQQLIAVEPPELQFPHRLTRLVSNRELAKEEEPPWWDGMEIVPPRPRLGILAKWEQQKNQRLLREKPATTRGVPSTAGSDRPSTAATVRYLSHRLSDHGVSESAESTSGDESEDTDESESEDVSDESGGLRRDHWTEPDRSDGVRGWELKQSTRANQDNQRDLEEAQTRHMANFLARRTHADSGGFGRRGHWPSPARGAYVKVEHEWKDSNCGTPYGHERHHSVSSRYRVSR